MQINKNSFCAFVRSECELRGFSGIAFLNLSGERLIHLRDMLSKNFLGKQYPDWPEYMRKTAVLRAEPLKVFPWAKTLALFSMPFHNLPWNNCFLPQASCNELSGLVAGYAGRMDYHVFLRDNLDIFSASLKKFLGRDFKTEICVDTKPVAEKPIAAFAGLGAPGLNSCLLCKGEGSGTCLGILVLDMELPETEPVDFAAPCSTCGKCVELCPTGAITGKGGDFKYSRCRSYLTMEKKGFLEKDDRQRLGEWIFGCDICTSACPESKIPQPLKADLEWLLLEDDSTVNGIIRNSALAYPGMKLLRRNALCVLGNKPSARGKSIIAKFAASVKDEMLKVMSDTVLKELNI
jgi:epoxyqueuosine reductase